MDTKVSYWLTFYNKNDGIDDIKEYSSDGEARAIMNKYNVIDSGEVYSRITLNKVDSDNPSSFVKIAELSF